MKNKLFKILMLIMAFVMTFTAVGCSGGDPTDPPSTPPPTTGGGFDPDKVIGNLNSIDYSLFNIAGQDAEGRFVKPAHNYEDDGSAVEVGVFYSIWHGGEGAWQQNIHTRDIQKMIDAGNDPIYSGAEANYFYYWGEPLYGYYRSTDKWVIMRHMELLTMAGVDFLCIDATNGQDYPDAGHALFDTLLELQEQGFIVPRFCFYTNTDSGATVDKIYQHYYQYENQKYQSLWYAPFGKPLIMGTTENNIGSDIWVNNHIEKSFVSQSMRNFFDVKESQWPTREYLNNKEDPNGIPWMTWHDIPGVYNTGFMSVPVAMHGRVNTSVSYKDANASRGYNRLTKQRGTQDDINKGLAFQGAFDIAYNQRANLNGIIVTGWNEWIAQKQYVDANSSHFVDVYNNEFSRDIEMTRNTFNFDNYYMQLVQNIRKIRYLQHEEGEANIIPEITIDIQSDNFEYAWAEAQAVYEDFSGDAMARNSYNASTTNNVLLTDTTNRNDIQTIKVAHDSENAYVYVECKQNITSYISGTNWMNILIGTEYGSHTFSGYNYFINRTPNSNGTTSIESYNNGTFTKVGDAKYRVKGNVIVFEIPLTAIGDNVSFRFKVCDNIQRQTDISDYYISGDSAPLGRLGFAYNT